MKAFRILPALLLLVLFGAGCTAEVGDGAGSAAAPSSPAAALIAIKNARVPIDGLLTGGQPTPEQIDAAARSGVRTVINLRTAGEEVFAWEPAAVERAGMRYLHLPVAGAEGLTRDNVDRLDELLEETMAEGPVLLHCASGNRIGALLALRAAWKQGVAPDEALHYGLASGLTRLEPTTRELLGVTVPSGTP